MIIFVDGGKAKCRYQKGSTEGDIDVLNAKITCLVARNTYSIMKAIVKLLCLVHRENVCDAQRLRMKALIYGRVATAIV